MQNSQKSLRKLMDFKQMEWTPVEKRQHKITKTEKDTAMYICCLNKLVYLKLCFYL